MLRIRVAAHPGSRHQRIELLDDNSLGVWVRAKPVDGQANRAIEVAIANALGLRPRQVRLVGGEISRHKIVAIDAPSLDTVRARLLAHAVQMDTD